MKMGDIVSNVALGLMCGLLICALVEIGIGLQKMEGGRIDIPCMPTGKYEVISDFDKKTITFENKKTGERITYVPEPKGWPDKQLGEYAYRYILGGYNLTDKKSEVTIDEIRWSPLFESQIMDRHDGWIKINTTPRSKDGGCYFQSDEWVQESEQVVYYSDNYKPMKDAIEKKMRHKNGSK